jgi:hypothetical protein
MSEVERTLSSSRRQGASVGRSGAQITASGLSAVAQNEVSWLLNSSGRRTTTPIRKSFARSDDREMAPPLAQIVSTRGRGGAVALKLYLGLLRRSSAAPYDTNLSARRWAALLDLAEPNTLGARRITDAMKRLEALRLVSVAPARGEASVVTLLREDGSAKSYSLPSAPGKDRRYLQVPDRLWEGYIQTMSAPGLAMLLVLLAEPASSRDGMWWSVEKFPDWYGISASMRAKGTNELLDLGLLRVTKRKLDTPKGGNGDERDRVRNVYRLRNPAAFPPRPVAVRRRKPKRV